MQKLKVVIYNIRHGAGMDLEVNLERIAEVLRGLDPDLVLLQEVDNKCGRSGKVDQMARLGELTGMHHAFGPFFEHDGGLYGLGALGKVPVVEVEEHGWAPEQGSRFFFAVRLETEEWYGKILFVDVHLYVDIEDRREQANRLVRMFAGEKRPMLVGGDFNSMPGSEIMELVGAHWTVSAKEGSPLTFPADEPVREIDFFVYRPAEEIDVVNSWVVDEQMASDHRPVVVELAPR
ncbi:MAG: endonuclease [Gemmatimonadetes bacterium]|jgi:endonuclease/exonuclease/phosphatase family metal-dependent hydrolase|nr:endonuclease [Gemmatimonadota bacterium]